MLPTTKFKSWTRKFTVERTSVCNYAGYFYQYFRLQSLVFINCLFSNSALIVIIFIYHNFLIYFYIGTRKAWQYPPKRQNHEAKLEPVKFLPKVLTLPSYISCTDQAAFPVRFHPYPDVELCQSEMFCFNPSSGKTITKRELDPSRAQCVFSANIPTYLCTWNGTEPISAVPKRYRVTDIVDGGILCTDREFMFFCLQQYHIFRTTYLPVSYCRFFRCSNYWVPW